MLRTAWSKLKERNGRESLHRYRELKISDGGSDDLEHSRREVSSSLCNPGPVNNVVYTSGRRELSATALCSSLIL